MKKYNLSRIMTDAWNLKRNRPEKYTTFSMALTTSWKLYKKRMDIQNREEEISEYHNQVKKEVSDRLNREEISKTRSVEVETKIVSGNGSSVDYGYGRGDHYNMFSGWGSNYCGD